MWRQLTVILVVIKYGSPTATGRITFTSGEVHLRGTLWGIMSIPDGMVFGGRLLTIYNSSVSLAWPVQHNLLVNNMGQRTIRGCLKLLTAHDWCLVRHKGSNKESSQAMQDLKVFLLQKVQQILTQNSSGARSCSFFSYKGFIVLLACAFALSIDNIYSAHLFKAVQCLF